MSEPSLRGDPPDRVEVSEEDLYEHVMRRMLQRGITLEEIRRALTEGWEAADAKPGTLEKMLVFPYDREWEGQIYEEKEVTVYF